MELEKTDIQNERENNENKKTSLMIKMKDPLYRSLILHWMCLPLEMFNLGIINSLGGTTNLDLQIITSTTHELSFFYFTASSVGYLFGSLFGGVLHGKINSYLLMFISGVLAGIASIASPYCFNFGLMFLILCIVGFFLGVILCVSNAEHMQIWGTKGNSLLQLMNMVYAVGGVIGPMIASPFITEKEITNKTLHQNLTLLLDSNTTHALNSTLPRTSNVHYAFLIGGLVLLVTAIPTLLVLIMSKESIFHAKKEEAQQENVDRKLPLRLKIFLISLLIAFYFTYSSVEVTFNSYLMTFVVEEYEEVTKQQGAYLSTFYWSSFAAARFISIFTSNYISARRLLYAHLSLLAASFSGFLVSALYSRMDAITAFTCLVGVACSAIFPIFMSWTECEIMKVNGIISACAFVGSNCGIVVFPIIVARLMEHVSNLWFCYSLMASITLAILSFISLLFINRYYVEKKYGSLDEIRTRDTQETTHNDFKGTVS